MSTDAEKRMIADHERHVYGAMVARRLERRDQFAIAALTALVTSRGIAWDNADIEHTAAFSVQIADAMLAALDEEPKP